MQKKFVRSCLFLVVSFLFGGAHTALHAASHKTIFEQWIPRYCYWLDPASVPVSLLDSTLTEKIIDTSVRTLVRHALYLEPIPRIDLDVFYRSVWKPDSFSHRAYFDTDCEDYLRNRLHRAYWTINPYLPFSQVWDMLRLENVRDTVLLRKRRGKYVKMRDLSHEIRFNPNRNTNVVKRVQKPLINPKDSVTRWAFNFSGGINLAQTSLTNWAAGGESSIAGNGRLNMDLAYRRGGHKWETKLKTEYGTLYDRTNKWNKTVDNILFSMRYGYAIPGGRFYYTAYMDFQTQYDKGYAEVGDEDYISDFLSPAYLNVSVGMEYKLAKLLSVYLAPLSSRTTFVKDAYLSSLGSFGVVPGKNAKFEIGMTLTTAIEWKFWKNMVLKTDANFFTPYDKDFGNIVVDWNVYLDLYVNKVFKAMIGTSLKYDDKVTTVDADGNVRGPRVQFKEMVTVGIGYSFRYKSKHREF